MCEASVSNVFLAGEKAATFFPKTSLKLDWCGFKERKPKGGSITASFSSLLFLWLWVLWVSHQLVFLQNPDDPCFWIPEPCLGLLLLTTLRAFSRSLRQGIRSHWKPAATTLNQSNAASLMVLLFRLFCVGKGLEFGSWKSIGETDAVHQWRRALFVKGWSEVIINDNDRPCNYTRRRLKFHLITSNDHAAWTDSDPGQSVWVIWHALHQLVNKCDFVQTIEILCHLSCCQKAENRLQLSWNSQCSALTWNLLQPLSVSWKPFWLAQLSEDNFLTELFCSFISCWLH